MKRVPVMPEQHRKAKAKAAEMGLTLERFVGGVIDYAYQQPAEDILGWLLPEIKRREESRTERRQEAS